LREYGEFAATLAMQADAAGIPADRAMDQLLMRLDL
jgi:hypothetical protein